MFTRTRLAFVVPMFYVSPVFASGLDRAIVHETVTDVKAKSVLVEFAHGPFDESNAKNRKTLTKTEAVMILTKTAEEICKKSGQSINVTQISDVSYGSRGSNKYGVGTFFDLYYASFICKSEIFALRNGMPEVPEPKRSDVPTEFENCPVCYLNSDTSDN
jgi:hypothetical protein